ncbi:MAG: DNA-processing protein DprA [Gammaproteobacteria bacterium]|nr:DNA-processing protein DprA [Gammaproteobacteria bacterium]
MSGMDAAQRLIPWLKLVHAPRISAAQVRVLMDNFDTPGAVCATRRATLRDAGLDSESIAALHAESSPAIDAELAWAEQSNNHILTMDDPAYPELLRELSDAPPLLYVRGDCEVLGTLQLAMVGSRKPTGLGRRTAFEFARYLAGCGLTITSGLALGIDAASHAGALRGDGLTVAVMGSGHQHIYPRENAGLAEEIAAQGALISELPLQAPPRREHFPRRNRLLSGLSAGVLVVEAATRSGSLITARLANEQGREVFAVPGSIHSPQSRGSNGLIRSGAKLVETAEHILEELAPYAAAAREANTTTPRTETTTGNLDSEYRMLLEAVDFSPTTVDKLVENTGHSAAEVASMLLILELQGHVEAVAGGLYVRVP